jgi:Tol biopolymer transport system component
VDAFLTDDGLTLLYSSGHANGTMTESADLYVAVRSSTSEPFSATAPLSELNTAAEERDPWLSADGKTLFFVSNRDGLLNIYQATAMPAP